MKIVIVFVLVQSIESVANDSIVKFFSDSQVLVEPLELKVNVSERLGTNASITCSFSKKDKICELYDCDRLNIVWNFPRQLTFFQVITGDKGRVVVVDKNSESHLRSQLVIEGAGYLHQGEYVCFVEFKKNVESIGNRTTVTVTGGESGEPCDFSDQCQSLNCVESVCHCDSGQVFVDGECFNGMVSEI